MLLPISSKLYSKMVQRYHNTIKIILRQSNTSEGNSFEMELSKM